MAPVPDPTRRLLLIAALATAILGVALALRVPIGIPSEWIWRPNQLPVQLSPAGWAALALVIWSWFTTRAGWWESLPAARRAVALGLLILIVFVLQCGLLNATGLPWITPGAVIASPVATTYYSVSLDVRDPGKWIATYADQMRTLPYHARTHPPGFVLLFVALRRICEWGLPHPPPVLSTIAESYRVFGIGPTSTDAAAAIAGAFLFALIGALSLLPVYLLGRRFVNADAALCAVLLVAAMPSLLLFGASSDEIVLTLAVLVIWAGYAAWHDRCHAERSEGFFLSWHSTLRALLTGLVLAIALFFTLGMLILAAWLAVWTIIGIARAHDRPSALRHALLVAAAAAVGFIGFYLVLYLGLGYHPIAVAREGLLAHRGVSTVEAARSYWEWLVMDPVELIVFAGLPLVVAAVWSWRGTAKDPSLARLRTFLLAWMIALVLLDLSGTVRGEVGRIWLFLLWPAALAAGPRLASLPRRSLVITVLVALQVWQAILMRGYLTLYDIF
jgi:hypothetical protein